MKFKKFLAGAVATTLVAVSLPQFTAAETYEDFSYTVLDNGTIAITGYNGDGGDVVIPAEIDGKAVTEIGSDALSVFYNNADIVSVEIPDSVTSIGYYAFAYCSNLVSVTIPDSVTNIGANAFKSTPFLDDQTEPLKYAGNWLVYCDHSEENVEIKEGTVGIASSVFFVEEYEESQIKSITIPASLLYICEHQSGKWGGLYIPPSYFTNCTNLEAFYVSPENTAFSSVDGVLFDKNKTTLICYPRNKLDTSYKMPSSVELIEYQAFRGASNLTEVIMSDGVKEILPCTFYDCTNLTSINIPDTLTGIGEMAFYRTSLASINIPDSVTSIGRWAFNRTPLIDEQTGTVKYADKWFITYDNSITEVEIANGTVGIADYAFDTMTEDYVNTTPPESILTSVTIPDSILYIGSSAFCNCSNLISIAIPNNVLHIGSQAFYLCENLTSVIIPDSVTTIGSGAFYGCLNLVSIVIPDSVTTIGEPSGFYEVFGNCSDDLTIYGYTGSYAETYAEEHKINFVAITETDPDVTEPEETTTTTAAATQPEATTTTTTQPDVTTTTATTTQSEVTTTTATTIQSEVTTTATTTQPTSTEKIIEEDKDTGIQLLAADGVIAEDVKLNVVIGNADINTDAHLYVLNITLVNANGETVAPNGSVTVRIPLPEGFESSDTYYVFYQADDGTLTDMHATYENGYVSFVTNHFSTYILTTKNIAEDKDAIPNTGVVILIIPAIAAAAGVIISKKRK